MSDALTKLEAGVRADLTRIAHPGAAWLEPKTGPDGRPALDVLIIGAGQSGIAIGFGLMRSRVSNILLLDKAAEGMEGHGAPMPGCRPCAAQRTTPVRISIFRA
jgi:hypothetical protein